MGNCQAAEAEAVVVQHPGSNKVERFYWAVSAQEVMNSNPGNYVALVINSTTTPPENGTPAKQLKLLRPDDTLVIGQVYRLISFEDVLKEFASTKSRKLGKLLKERDNDPNVKSNSKLLQNKIGQEVLGVGSSTNCSRGAGRPRVGGQWRPTLQSIAELGT